MLIWLMLTDASTALMLMTIKAIYRCVLNGGAIQVEKAYRWQALTPQRMLFLMYSSAY